jgi:hypothetical protein
MSHSTLGAVRIGLIGDVHAEDGFLEIALNHLQALRVDVCLCVGDVVDGLGAALWKPAWILALQRFLGQQRS